MNHRKVRNKMRIIDADKFLKYLIFSKHIDGLTCGEVKEAIEMCKVDIFGKLRAEILEEKECAYADFERYKVEYLGQDLEDALDSLPQDEFRYGMERAIELIDKYKAESEDI